MHLNPKITVKLFADGNFKGFGPGVAELLERIEKSGSLRAACVEMKMAYSKGWTVLKNCEKALGFALVERSTGGENGGGSLITKEGKKILTCYRKIEKDINQRGKKLLEELW